MNLGYVYMMSNKYRGLIYIGVTTDILKRSTEHKFKMLDGFTKRYDLIRLVWFERYENINDAMEMERKLKNLSRAKKIEIIERLNTEWNDLYSAVTQSADPALLLAQPAG
ncbi:MAG: GIY-YIG nuclease family protein [Rickettsiales bacterium]